MCVGGGLVPQREQQAIIKPFSRQVPAQFLGNEQGSAEALALKRNFITPHTEAERRITQDSTHLSKGEVPELRQSWKINCLKISKYESECLSVCLSIYLAVLSSRK